jgi:hypothetical protein
LKASIGIRRSESEAEKNLKALRTKYGCIPKFSDVPLEQLRIYQCAFAIFDSDGSDTIDMKELLDTLEVYGRGHQILDRYSDQIANRSGKVQKEGHVKKLAEKLILESKSILNGESSLGQQPSTPSATSLNLEEFVVFMEIVTHTGRNSSPLEVEFGSFCKNVMDVMLHTSEALGSIYRNLSSDIQKKFRSTSYLGKLCQEVPISNGDILYSRGEHPIVAALCSFGVVDSRV